MVCRNDLSMNLFHAFFAQNDVHAYALFDVIFSGHDPVDYQCIFINHEYERITGLEASSIIGKTILKVMPYWDDNLIEMYHEISSKRSTKHFQYFSSEMKKHFDVWVFCPKAEQLGIVLYEMTERVDFQLRLEYVYYHDPLTNLLNKQYVKDEVAKHFTQAIRPVALIAIDINALRNINDVLGYEFGDEVLKWVASSLKQACRENMTPIRWGNDNFLVIAYGMDAFMAEQLMIDIERYLSQSRSKEEVHLSVSIGYYIHTCSLETVFQAIAKAEKAMAENKYLNMTETNNAPIEMVLTILHEKNSREEAHSKRVSNLCVMIGRKMGLPRKDIDKLRLIGLVHDIGKIGIDEAILNKKGQLTEDEYIQIKKHPEIGFRILTTSQDTAEIAYFILSHHERIDGKGYPNGIKGSDIPLFSKILSVADSFDAMTRERTYKNTMSNAEAAEELQRCAGKQFDPDIVAIFTKIIDGYSAQPENFVYESNPPVKELNP